MTTRWPFRVTPPLLDVVRALLESGEEIHGYRLVGITQRTATTIYQVADRLREAEWLQVRWEEQFASGRPSRRYYSLTDLGRKQGRALLNERRPSVGRVEDGGL